MSEEDITAIEYFNCGDDSAKLSFLHERLKHFREIYLRLKSELSACQERGNLLKKKLLLTQRQLEKKNKE